MQTLQRFTIQTASTVAPQRLVDNEREYLVAPCVMIIQGVLNGAYVSGDAIQACQWNGLPVVINHPLNESGEAISANDPQVLARQGCGRVFRTRYSTLQRGGLALVKAQAEIWLDVREVQMLGGEAVEAFGKIESQTPLEVSTAFYSDTDSIRGSFLGLPYTEVHTNLRGDHLALLPNAIGACSWETGCGMPRLNHEQAVCDPTCTCDTCHMRTAMDTEQPPPTKLRALWGVLREFFAAEVGADADSSPPAPVIAAADPLPIGIGSVLEDEEARALALNQSDIDLRESIYSALALEMERDVTPIFLQDVDQIGQWFTYRRGERLLRRSYTFDGNGVLLLVDDTTDVQRRTEFIPVPDSGQEFGHQSGGYVLGFAATDSRCPGCGGYMSMAPDVNGVIQPCPTCGWAPGTPSTNHTSHQETPMADARPTALPPTLRFRINALISDPLTDWNETHRPHLETLSEPMLIFLEQQPKRVPVVEIQPLPEPQTAEEAIARMPPHLQETMLVAYRGLAQRKQAAMAVLIANKTCPFTQEELQSMTVERLEKLVSMAAQVDYTGNGLPAPRVAPEVPEEPPPAPNTMERVIARQKEQGLRV